MSKQPRPKAVETCGREGPAAFMKALFCNTPRRMSLHAEVQELI
jgi:hypothetical protein